LEKNLSIFESESEVMVRMNPLLKKTSTTYWCKKTNKVVNHPNKTVTVFENVVYINYEAKNRYTVVKGQLALTVIDASF